jgi:carbon-monoxide dehydrogenase medium subunit
MTALRYAAPRSLDEAVELLKASNGSASILAGGTDLLVQMRTGLRAPELVVDIKRIPELGALSLGPEGLRLGAAVCGAAIGEHADVAAAYPGLVEAAELIGSTQIQGRASVGGNLCNASPAADTVPALIALDARCWVAGPAGTRTVPVSEFTTGPGQTVLGPGELLVALEVDPRPARSADAYLRFIPRSEMDIAVVGAGVDVTLDAEGVCSAARVALGAVGPTAFAVPEAAAALIGSRLEDAALLRAAEAASAACRPIDDKRGTIVYRKKVAGVLVKRAAAIAAARAAERA